MTRREIFHAWPSRASQTRRAALANCAIRPLASAEDLTIVPGYGIVIVDGERRDAGAVAFVAAWRRAGREGGQPAGGTAFVNRRSASRFTFLVSPELATIAGERLERHGAMCCPQEPKLARYGPLRL